MGSYVDVEIEGHQIHDVCKLSRNEMHNGNTIWLMDGDDNLDIRNVATIFAGRDYVLVRDSLKPNDRLITSDLPSPIQGMPLRLAGSATTQSAIKETPQ